MPELSPAARSVRQSEFFLAASRLAFAASPLNSVVPNAKKPLASRLNNHYHTQLHVAATPAPNSPAICRVGPLSHSSLLKMLSWREQCRKHFTVSAAILHRVKVKVLWKQAEEGKITEEYFSSTVLLKCSESER